MIASARRAAALAAPLLLLAACAAGGDRPGATGATPADEAPPPSVSAPQAIEEPDPPAVAALPPPTAPAPHTAPQDFRRLLGEKGLVLKQWMGEVVFVRRDGAAEIWRFAADNCFLDVFLYRESDGLRVAHIEARSRSTGRITPQACYGRIISSQTAKPAS